MNQEPIDARFSDRARHAMRLAEQQARRLGHPYIGTEHILLGLAHEGGGLAYLVLEELRIDATKIEKQVNKLTSDDVCELAGGELPVTPRVKKVLQVALEESQRTDNKYVGTEHLLIAVATISEGCGWQVLANLGCPGPSQFIKTLDAIGAKILDEQLSTPSDEPEEISAEETLSQFLAFTNREIPAIAAAIDRQTKAIKAAIAATVQLEAAVRGLPSDILAALTEYEDEDGEEPCIP